MATADTAMPAVPCRLCAATTRAAIAGRCRAGGAGRVHGVRRLCDARACGRQQFSVVKRLRRSPWMGRRRRGIGPDERYPRASRDEHRVCEERRQRNPLRVRAYYHGRRVRVGPASTALARPPAHPPAFALTHICRCQPPPSGRPRCFGVSRVRSTAALVICVVRSWRSTSSAVSC